MIRAFAAIGFIAVLAAPLAAFASPPSGYGTEGANGQRLDARALSTFERGWNAANESKNRAESSAEWLRQHGKGFPSPF